MSITVKNLPKDIDSLEPDPGDVVIDNDGDAWFVTENLTVVNLSDAQVLELDDIRVVKIFSNCTLTLG